MRRSSSLARATLLLIAAGSLLVGVACGDSAGSEDGNEASGDGDGDGDGDGSSGDGDGDGDGDDGEAFCDPYMQDCPEGKKCIWRASITGTYEYVCVDVSGDRELGETCVHDGILIGTDDCDANGSCWGVVNIASPFEGRCRPHCGGTVEDPTCAETSEECAGGELPLCLPSCDPFAPGCAPDETCWYRPERGTFVCTPSSNNSDVGDDCFLSFDCKPGLVCRPKDTVPGCQQDECCTELCEVGGPDICTLEGATCVALGASFPYEDVGACLLPE